MNEETLKQLQEVFTPIAQKIGEGAGYGWEVVLKQQYLEAVMGLVYATMSIIGIFIVYKVCKHFLLLQEKDPDSDYGFFAILISVFIGIPCLMVFILGTETAITHFINPEFYAIKFFIHLVK